MSERKVTRRTRQSSSIPTTANVKTKSSRSQMSLSASRESKAQKTLSVSNRASKTECVQNKTCESKSGINGEKDHLYCVVARDCASRVYKTPAGLNAVVLPQNLLLFRGARPEFPNILVRPHVVAYFSDAATALHAYAQDDARRCVAYLLKSNVTLLDLSNFANIQHMHKLLEGKREEQRLLEVVTGFNITHLNQNDAWRLSRDCFYADKPPNEIRICTSGFLTEEDDQLDRFLSKRFAQLVCANGFDGWVIGTNLHRADLSPFHSEVMLCNASDKITHALSVSCVVYAMVIDAHLHSSESPFTTETTRAQVGPKASRLSKTAAMLQEAEARESTKRSSTSALGSHRSKQGGQGVRKSSKKSESGTKRSKTTLRSGPSIKSASSSTNTSGPSKRRSERLHSSRSRGGA